MAFSNLRIKEIDCVVKFTATEMNFTCAARHNHIIGVQISGSALHFFENQKFIIEEGCAYFLNQKDNYKVKVLESGTAFSIHFTTYESIDTDSFCIRLSKQNEFIRIFNRIEKKFFLKNDELGLMSELYNFCSILNANRQNSFFTKDKRMIDAEKYIHMHFTESNCLSEAAAKSSLSRRRFNELFKNCFGLTPNRYLTNLKIDHAKKLLMANYLKISQIADLCGFSDIYYFSKIFKSETNVTPTEYRNSVSINNNK